MKRLYTMIGMLLMAAVVTAQPGWVKKATKSVFTVKTFAADGSLIGSTCGFFTGEQGEGVSSFSPFKGASSAVVIDAQGKEMPVECMLGANDTYDVAKFRVAAKKTTPLTIAAANATEDTQVWLLPYRETKDIPEGTIRKAEHFGSNGHAYYTVALSMPEGTVSCPLINTDGEVIGLMQQPYKQGDTLSYAVSARVDNYSIKGLRIGVSGYYGHSFRNTLAKIGTEYEGVKGALAIISGDFTLNRFNWIARGNFTYAHLGDADKISEFNKSNYTHHKYQDGSPFANENLGSSAIAWGIEAGYDIFSQIHKTRALGQKLYVFGRYEYYNSMFRGTYKNLYKYTAKNRLAFGVNYYPIKQVVVKGEYSYRFFKKPNNNGLASDSPLYVQPYNNEPSINIGIAYSGWFL